MTESSDSPEKVSKFTLDTVVLSDYATGHTDIFNDLVSKTSEEQEKILAKIPEVKSQLNTDLKNGEADESEVKSVLDFISYQIEQILWNDM